MQLHSARASAAVHSSWDLKPKGGLTRPDLILQPGSAAQIGADRYPVWRPAGHFYFANQRTFQLLRHNTRISCTMIASLFNDYSCRSTKTQGRCALSRLAATSLSTGQVDDTSRAPVPQQLRPCRARWSLTASRCIPCSPGRASRECRRP